MEDYTLAVDYAEKRGSQYLKDDQGWKVNRNTNDVKVESKSSDRLNCKILRVHAWAAISLEEAFDTFPVLQDNKRLDWDTETRQVETIDKFSETEFIQVARTNAMARGLISPRDFVYAVKVTKTPNKIQLHGASVINPTIEVTKGHVRGHLGFFFQTFEKDPSRNGDIKMTYANEMDMKGSLFRSIVESSMPGVAADDGARWRAYLAEQGLIKATGKK